MWPPLDPPPPQFFLDPPLGSGTKNHFRSWCHEGRQQTFRRLIVCLALFLQVWTPLLRLGCTLASKHRCAPARHVTVVCVQRPRASFSAVVSRRIFLTVASRTFCNACGPTFVITGHFWFPLLLAYYTRQIYSLVHTSNLTEFVSASLRLNIFVPW